MKESYVEGPASHSGPESCADVREGTGEALTGAHLGEVLSRENDNNQGATQLKNAEANTIMRAMASA